MGMMGMPDRAPEGFEQRLVDGFWGVPGAIDQITADINRTLDSGQSAVVEWRVRAEKT